MSVNIVSKLRSKFDFSVNRQLSQGSIVARDLHGAVVARDLKADKSSAANLLKAIHDTYQILLVFTRTPNLDRVHRKLVESRSLRKGGGDV